MLSCNEICQAAQPFLAILLQRIFPNRPVVVVAPDLRTQESFQQDLETWLAAESQGPSSNSKADSLRPSTISHQLLFYPAWDILPHEGKLPHADVISDRLQTLIALTNHAPPIAHHGTRNTTGTPLVVSSITALLQKTFPPEDLKRRTRALNRGDRVVPLDLVEWLEEQGYEPEAQVTQKGRNRFARRHSRLVAAHQSLAGAIGIFRR